MFRGLALLMCTALFSAGVAAQDLRTFRRGGAGDPESLDPHKILSAFESTIMTDMFLPLATTAANDDAIPGLPNPGASVRMA